MCIILSKEQVLEFDKLVKNLPNISKILSDNPELINSSLTIDVDKIIKDNLVSNLKSLNDMELLK